jgi:two-component system, sensor histidine kinase LadS
MLVKLLRLTLMILLGWISAPAMATMATAEVDAGSDRLALSPFVSYYHDADGQNDAINMADLVSRGKFKPLPYGNATFGFNKGAHWLHASLRNRGHSEQRWLLVLEYPLLDYIDVHVRYANGDTRHFTSGDMQPFSSRSISYRQPNFWIELPRNEKVELLVRITSKSSIQAPLVLFTPTAFAENERDSQFVIGIYNGIIVALFFYNLVMWLLLRDQNNLWYVLHITGFGLVLFCLNGLAFEYLWPNSPWLANHVIPLSMCLSQLAMHQFTRIFLNLPTRIRKMDRISICFIAFYIIMTAASLVIDYSLAVKAITYSVFPGIIWVLTLSVLSINAGYKPAKLFLIAWAALLSGTFVYASVSFGLLPKIFITEYGIQIGSALEMLLLSFALAYRYAELKKENMQLVFQSKEKLEASVAKRTNELSQALELLAEANVRLRESSQRDSLTGLLNRRHFREQFELLIKQNESSGQSLGVLLIDLDNFKTINDQHGHLAGDECLRILSKTLVLAVAEQHACTGRFGGEEFVIIVPNCDILKLQKIAETIRTRIEAEVINYNSKIIRISTSIGAYCSKNSKIINADDALRYADEALYKAKHKGRNRVEFADDILAAK